MKAWLKWTLWVAGTLCFLVIAIEVLTYWMNEPMRVFFENRINRNLKGYRVHLTHVKIFPLDLELTLKGATIIQEKHPKPPVADFESIDFSLHWRAIIGGRIVGNVEMTHPKLNINLIQLREEASSPTKAKDRGWQEAVQAIYPLEINLFIVKDGDLVYVDQDPRNPLTAQKIFVQASNIRNVFSPDDPFPSPLKAEAVIFEKGKISVQGQANFLSEPIPSLSLEVAADKIPLNRFKPVLDRYHLSLKDGELTTSGHFELTPKVRAAHLNTLQVQNLNVDYIHPQTPALEAHNAAEKTREAAGEVSNNPLFQLRADQMQIRGDVGLINQKVDPNYRVFLSGADLQVSNLSNHFSQGPAQLTLKGAFMGSGRTEVNATFRPEDHGPDFEMKATIENTDLKAMNDLLRAYGNFDVNAGYFSLYSELKVKNNHVDGYVKPFFKEVDVYDRRKDEDKGLFKKMYEGLIEGVNDLLSRKPQDRMAARTEISGRTDNPKADTWRTVITLIQNAFFKAILPGFDRAISEKSG